jgi:hypothetical protein
MSRARSIGLLAWIVATCAAADVRAQIASSPVLVGPLLGPLATLPAPSLRLYGSDLGWTFEHQGRIVMLFGDTWPDAHFLCDTVPTNDDTQATLPLDPPAGLPPITFATRPGAPDDYATIRVLRDGTSISLGFGQTPLTGFSDGTDAFGVFGRGEIVACTRRSARARPSCRPHRHLACTQDLGRCAPAVLGASPACERATGAGCLPGQTCQATANGLCFDPSSSQNDGTATGIRASLAHTTEIAVQDASAPTDYRSVGTLTSNKFINVTARTVARLRGTSSGNDYGPGTDALLVWGRPGFVGEQGRQVELYLQTHRLPLPRDRAGRARLRPRFFAGVNGRTGEPRWSRRESRAEPLALDGVVGGDPREVLPIVDQMAIAWLPSPVGKWVMLYGGDLADYLLTDPANDRPGPAPGSIRIRFADHPWGPWTPPVPHLLPGDPLVAGTPYGPGGFLFHTQCASDGTLSCAPSDPSRPPDVFLPGCPSFAATFDVGRLYAPNIIDAYTRADGNGGVDVVWNVSTWNPYGVVVLKTKVVASAAADGRSRRR